MAPKLRRHIPNPSNKAKLNRKFEDERNGSEARQGQSRGRGRPQVPPALAPRTTCYTPPAPCVTSVTHLHVSRAAVFSFFIIKNTAEREPSLRAVVP
ncbi:hypothetical protein EVAR_67673_1 [Eumeta japonica]|uniref:Uncharacterized protein n=1 Tax=Eumeta variegata TaxID=151549 RepID=A0A4C1ZAB9_EUMVA|nr:hypothetical protein EVAR_67673_1 [Eumeta japonica]